MESVEIIIYGLALVAFGLVAVISVPCVRLDVAVCTCVLARAFCEIGHAAGVGLLPSGAIIIGLSVYLWVLYAFHVPRFWLQPSTPSVVFLIFLIVSGVTYFSSFGLSLDSSVYLLSLSSLLPLGALCSIAFRSLRYPRCTSSQVPDFLGSMVVAATAPALFLIVGYLCFPRQTIGLNMRAAGSFVHANAAGSFCAISLVFSVWLFWQYRKPSFAALAVVCLIAVLLTESLNSAASGLLGVVVLGLLLGRSAMERLIFLFACSSIAIGLYLFTSVGDRVREILGSDVTRAISSGVSENSFEWRLLNWSALIAKWESRPIFGFGGGSTLGPVQPYGGPAHSVYVQLLVEGGVVGVVLVAVLVVLLSASLVGRWRSDPLARPFLACAAAVFGCVAVNSLAANLLSSGAALYLCCVILFGLSASSRGRSCVGSTKSGAASGAINSHSEREVLF